MYLYNCNTNSNIKSHKKVNKIGSGLKPLSKVKVSTSTGQKQRRNRCCRRKNSLTQKNINYLKSLGLKIKKQKN